MKRKSTIGKELSTQLLFKANLITREEFFRRREELIKNRFKVLNIDLKI